MKIYLVGGAIRDKLLKLPIKDKDWLVVGATPEIMIKLGYQKVGSDFPVFIHPITKEEYALARTEKKVGKGYKGFITFFDSKVTIEDDLIRRDLTINAIACDKLGKYIDPYGGYRDIKLRILRHISVFFADDPLRILRVARFSAYLTHMGFNIAKETMFLMRKMVKKKELNFLKAERVWKETEKAMITFSPHMYFKILHDCHALNILFKKIKISKIYIINKIIYKLITNLKIISSITNELIVRCSLIFYILIKEVKQTEKNKKNLIIKLCEMFKVPNDIRDLSILSITCENLVKRILKRKKENIIIKILNHIDAWRKPYRIQQICAINMIYSYKKKKLNKYDYYFNNNILLNSFKIANKININSIIQKGFYGIQIKNEIQKKRIKAIKSWQDSLI